MTDDSTLPQNGPQRYVIVGTGEGASVQVVTGDIRQAVHDSFCSCELPWEQCATEFIKDDIRRLDQADEWSTDEDGRELAMTYEGEQYSLTVYKDWNFKGAPLPPPQARKPLDQQAVIDAVTIGILANWPYECLGDPPEPSAGDIEKVVGPIIRKFWLAESAPQEAGARDLDKVEIEAAIRKRARRLKREIESAHAAERKAKMAAYDAAPDNSSDHRRFCEGWEAAKEWAASERGVPLEEKK
jgi:hypothetical protein